VSKRSLPGPFNNDFPVLLPEFPDKFRKEFDDIAWRIGRLTGGTRAAFSGKYLLVFHFRAPDDYDRYQRQPVRFGIWFAVSQEPVLVVANNRNGRPDSVLEWGPDAEIIEAHDYLKRQTLLDELASL